MTEHHEPQLGVLGPDAFNDAPRRDPSSAETWDGGSSARRSRSTPTREATALMARVRPPFPHFPCCFVGWDNTARRGRDAIVMVDSTPELFKGQLSLMVSGVRHKPPEERVVFVNAWNEWAEGMYLEPDAKHGHDYLKVVTSVLDEISARCDEPHAAGP